MQPYRFWSLWNGSIIASTGVLMLLLLEGGNFAILCQIDREPQVTVDREQSPPSLSSVCHPLRTGPEQVFSVNRHALAQIASTWALGLALLAVCVFLTVLAAHSAATPDNPFRPGASPGCSECKRTKNRQLDIKTLGAVGTRCPNQECNLAVALQR